MFIQFVHCIIKILLWFWADR